MRFAGAALQALAASHMDFRGDEVSFFHARDFAPVRGNFAAKFVAGNQRRMNAVLRPAVPVINVEIGAADGGDLHLDQHVGASEARNLDFANIRARLTEANITVD